MRGTWQSDGGGLEVLGVLGALAVVAAAVWLIITLLWLIAVIVGLALAAVIVLLVWLSRRGGAVAAGSWQPGRALPGPTVTPVASRPARALPAPQQLHVHFHGPDAVQAVNRLGGIWSDDFAAYASGQLDASKVHCALCMCAPCRCPAFGTPEYFALLDWRHGRAARPSDG